MRQGRWRVGKQGYEQTTVEDGKGRFIELVNQALDVVDAGARLDEIASQPRLA